MAIQGHPRSLILAPIVYAISYWSSIVTLVLSCPVSEILQIAREEIPHPYSARILGVSFGLYVVAPRSEDPKLIIRVTNFELVQPTCMPTTYQRYRQTDRRTTWTYDSNTALALRASRGENAAMKLEVESN